MVMLRKRSYGFLTAAFLFVLLSESTSAQLLSKLPVPRLEAALFERCAPAAVGRDEQLFLIVAKICPRSSSTKTFRILKMPVRGRRVLARGGVTVVEPVEDEDAAGEVHQEGPGSGQLLERRRLRRPLRGLRGGALSNDTYGHRAGDQALCQVARCIRQSIRPYDICARYGGDESWW
jgi:hypothetical protein